MNTTINMYALILESQDTARMAVLVELNQFVGMDYGGMVTLTCFYKGQCLSQRQVNLENFQAMLGAIQNWLGEHVCVRTSSLYPSPIIRWE